jgi:hypothetical protein
LSSTFLRAQVLLTVRAGATDAESNVIDFRLMRGSAHKRLVGPEKKRSRFDKVSCLPMAGSLPSPRGNLGFFPRHRQLKKVYTTHHDMTMKNCSLRKKKLSADRKLRRIVDLNGSTRRSLRGGRAGIVGDAMCVFPV